MRLIVDGLPTRLPVEFVQSLTDLSLSTGAVVELRIGSEEALVFDTSTIRNKSGERPSKSAKSEDSPKPEFLHLKLQLTLRSFNDGSVMAAAYLRDSTDSLVGEVLTSSSRENSTGSQRYVTESKELTFIPSISPKPTSTESTSSTREPWPDPVPGSMTGDELMKLSKETLVRHILKCYSKRELLTLLRKSDVTRRRPITAQRIERFINEL